MSLKPVIRYPIYITEDLWSDLSLLISNTQQLNLIIIAVFVVVGEGQDLYIDLYKCNNRHIKSVMRYNLTPFMRLSFCLYVQVKTLHGLINRTHGLNNQVTILMSEDKAIDSGKSCRVQSVSLL